MSEKWIDRSWKDMITENADDAILFFKPDLAADRDCSRKPFLIPNELPAIDTDSDKGSRNSDVGLSVPLKTGEDQRIAFHIEQQHRNDKYFFAKRMFQSYYRISDKLQMPVTSLAIFTGNITPIDIYTASCYGTEVNFRYSFFHVASADIKKLENDERIFALVVLAARRMLDAGENPADRGKYSLELLNLTKERGYDAERARSVQKFIYRILRIRDEKIDPKVREVWRMQLIPIDEAVREIQIRDAKEEKAIEVARSMLADGLPAETIRKYTGLDESSILSLG
ncbi:MAG: hypothetical protein LBI74_06000 [Synergistaceae bacterium]|jgi:hypothetical protein|nr:hypothetical protein [Synergistaceae bacterium]